MNITAQTICVDYAPQLARSLSLWAAGCDRLLVVTAERDAATRELCEQHGVPVLLTDVFWDRGAKFNKGAGISAGFDHLQSERPSEWHLFFDADIIPPPDWHAQLEKHRVTPGRLYGSDRFLENGRLIREGELAGCFHLAHASDPAMAVRPIVDTHWTHAGNYDSTFQCRWPNSLRVKLPLRMTHVGDPFRNWCGVGNAAGMGELWAARRRHGGWQHERIAE